MQVRYNNNEQERRRIGRKTDGSEAKQEVKAKEMIYWSKKSKIS